MRKRQVNEAEFRREYESSARRSGAFVSYVSTKEKRGVPDLFLCRDGISIWLELKFAASMPESDGSNALKHSVTKLQLSFLRSLNKHGGLGVVAVGYLCAGNGIEVAYFLPDQISENGNVKLYDIKSCHIKDNTKDGVLNLWKIKEHTPWGLTSYACSSTIDS